MVWVVWEVWKVRVVVSGLGFEDQNVTTTRTTTTTLDHGAVWLVKKIN